MGRALDNRGLSRMAVPLPITPEDDDLSDILPSRIDEEHFSIGIEETGERAKPPPAPRKYHPRKYHPPKPRPQFIFTREPDDYKQPWDRGKYP